MVWSGFAANPKGKAAFWLLVKSPVHKSQGEIRDNTRVNSRYVAPIYPLTTLCFAFMVLKSFKGGNMKNPRLFFSKIMSLAFWCWTKISSSPDSKSWSPNCFRDHSLKFSNIPSFQSLCVLVKEFPMRGELSILEQMSEQAERKRLYNELESKGILSIRICHQTHHQRSAWKLPLLNFFFYFVW